MQRALKLFVFLLFSRERWTTSQLATNFDCSRQSIFRIVDDLNLAVNMRQPGDGNADTIKRETIGKSTRFWIDKPREVSPVAISGEKLATLNICADFMGSLLPPKMKQALGETLLLNEYYLAQDDVPVKARATRLDKGHIDYAPFEEHLNKLTRAMTKDLACEVTYRKQLSSEPYTFLYAPKGLVHYHESILVVGWKVEDCRPLKLLRETTLALQRVREVKESRRTTISVPMPGNTTGVGFGLMDYEPVKVCLQFSPKVGISVAERIWSEDQELKISDDGSVELTMTAKNKWELQSWVMGYGTEAKIIAPKWLARELAQNAREIADQYDE